MTKLIAWMTSILVLTITLISFALSYNALRDLNQQYGVSGYLLGIDLSYLWPLLLDFSLLVFSLCVVTAHLYGESVWRQWSLTILYTLATVAMNTIHVWPDMLPILVIKIAIACIPPVSLVFSFETLMGQLRSSVKRGQQQATITGYDNALSQAQQAFDDLLQRVSEREAQYQADIAATESRLQEAQQSLDEARNPVDTRRAKLLSLIENYRAEFGEEPTQGYLAQETGVSIQTIRADRKALNGKVQNANEA